MARPWVWLTVASLLAALLVSVHSATPAAAASPPSGSVCDIYTYYGTPCAGAYSMTRAMYAGYDGPLYQVTRASDSTTADIGLLSQGGDVNASEQDSFCSGTQCTITKIYDQSPDGNNLTVAPGGGAAPADQPANASALPITIGGNNKAYGVDFTGQIGYRDDNTRGIATGSEPEGMYMVTSGTHVNSGCCFDFGNVETNNDDDGAGTMDAVNFTTACPDGPPAVPCNGGGPWVQADLENGLFQEGSNTSNNPNEPSLTSDFVTAMLKNNGTSNFELEGGNAQSGGLSVFWNGNLPPGTDGTGQSWVPMKKQGAVEVGTGGDNSNRSRSRRPWRAPTIQRLLGARPLLRMWSSQNCAPPSVRGTWKRSGSMPA